MRVDIVDTHTDQALLAATLQQIFGEHCSPTDLRDAETTEWSDGCWQALDEAGLLRVGVAEAAGGSGGTLADACTLAMVAGRHAVPLPVAEGSLLAAWFADTGLELPPGVLTVAPVPHEPRLFLRDARVTGLVERVPWGARADAVLAVAESDSGPCAVVLDPARATCIPGRSLAGEPRDGLTWEGAEVADGCRSPVDPEAIAGLKLRGALARTLMIAGAMQRTAELSVAHARSRTQFGRPIAAFQAVGHRLVQMRAETELVALAAMVAARRFAEAGTDAWLEVGSAASVAAAAVIDVTKHAHQVHGAIGMTREYPLHHFTRRLWSWRYEWWTERRDAGQLGRQLVAVGAPSLWTRVAGY